MRDLKFTSDLPVIRKEFENHRRNIRATHETLSNAVETVMSVAGTMSACAEMALWPRGGVGIVCAIPLGRV
jgi:hypothetical protein